MMRLGSLLQAAGVLAEVDGDAVLDLAIQAITADSRLVMPGCLFVAVAGSRTHGIQHTEAAVAAGAVAIVSDVATRAAVPVLVVPDAAHALGHLASAWHGHPSKSLQVLGITGTNGKTTSALLVAQLLHAAGHKVAALGTLGVWTPAGLTPGQLTTPDAMSLQATLSDQLRQGTTHVVMEVSSHALMQGRVAGVVFWAAAWTNLSQDHLDYHGDMDSYAAAKLRLFSDYGLTRTRCFVNADDDSAARAWDLGLAEAFSMGAHPAAEHQLWRLSCGATGLSGTLRSPGRRDLAVTTPLLGRHNAENLTIALLLARSVGVSDAVLAEACPKLNAPRGRLEPVANELGALVLVDYAHTPDALQKVLATLRPLVAPGARLITVFGCGGDRDRGKRPQMGAVAAQWADLTLVTSDNPRSESPQAIADAVAAGLRNAGAVELTKLVPSALAALGKKRGFVVEVDRSRAIRRAIGVLQAGDVLCIAGKGHETTQTLGTEIRPFDDAAVAAGWLAQHKQPTPAPTPEHRVVESGGYTFDGFAAAAATAGTLLVRGHKTSQRLCTDSRHLQAGDLFVALSGERFDAGEFVQTAIEQGAAGIVCTQPWAERQQDAAAQAGCFLVQVPDTLEALEGLTVAYRRRFAARTVGVTGSNGKTTTKELTALALSPLGPVLATAGNFNNRIGVPLTVAQLAPHHRAAVIEMGMSVPGEIRRLAKMGWPEVAVITNVGEAHLEGMGTVEAIAQEKFDLCRALSPAGIAILPFGDPWLEPLAHTLRCRVLRFGLSGGDAHVVGPVRSEAAADGQMRVVFAANVLGQAVSVSLPGLGIHLAHNALAALLAASVLGVDLSQAAAALQRYQPVGQRMLPTRMGPWLVLEDCYNANPRSTAAALTTLGGLPGPRVAVLGSMLELGPTGPALHEQVGAAAGPAGVQLLVAMGDFSSDYLRGAATAGVSAVAVATPEAAAQAVASALANGGTILVKGSRGARMERVVAALRDAAKAVA
jgi:murE/murF fusion protein